ncbi:hypothetical protein RHMOL_Rhmol10G0022800 [Rhododendron molle]|uniref:Uncharacterized protein n=1 Tax=Rhododendron molle TaxID=49168 RepID=A0ACC0LZ80_RHOML|nr:hypothetical protein RHMOL_Rhmol10G0022800 [Rhododendron molle]
MEEERSNRKRKRPRRRNNRAEKSSNNPKHRDQVVNKIDGDGDEGGDDSGPSGAPPAAANRRVSSAFLDKMRAKLSGGHFRMINEKLYTCTGSEALDYFKEDPTLFNVYHTGYQEQMTHWPKQPVNIIIKWLKDRSPSLLVADFGCGENLDISTRVYATNTSAFICKFVLLVDILMTTRSIMIPGDARLARNVKNKVFSFDLVSQDPSVIACDMSNTPLDTSSIDVAVFCLSLMGTNFASYLREAHRVLKKYGWLLIAEVKSRFDQNNGGADPDRFSKAICDLGFASVSKDLSNKMFILLYFKKKEKQNSKNGEIVWPELKPCLYKRR